MNRMTITIKKAIPHPRDVRRNRFLSIISRPEKTVREKSNSDVTKRVIAVNASQRPMSITLKGKPKIIHLLLLCILLG
jgi:hypothetical protein